MALIVLSWALPPQEQIDTYTEKARTVWIPAVLKQPGLKEFRAYRNPYQTTPQVVIHTEFDSLASCVKYLESEDYTTVLSGLRAVGCTNITAEMWGASPVVPEPLKPPSG